MPFPSAGCQPCKTRRIKCDEAQPICRKCVKSHRICYGMGAGQAWSVVHNENAYASGKNKRPRGPRSTPLEALTGNLHAVLQRPQGDLKTQAIMYYLHYHLQPQKDVPKALKRVSDDFLPLWISRPECPILDLSVSSMALAVFSRTQQHPPAAIEASINYQQLLKVTRTTILSLHQGNVEDCLLAIFFMSRYEDAVLSPGNHYPKTSLRTSVPSYSHHDGALAILKKWKDHLSHSQPASDVIKLTRRGMIRSALMRNLALPKWMREGSSFGEHGLELEYDCVVVRIINLRQQLNTLVKEKTCQQHTPYELTLAAGMLDKEARDIDGALQDWISHFPSAWCYQRHTLPTSYPWSTNDFYSPIVQSYSSHAYAVIWNQYYATRMLLNSTHLNILQLSCSTVNGFALEQRLECLSNLKTMADDLASSLPFSLQKFTVANSPNASSHENTITPNTNEPHPYIATLIIWPLTIASSLSHMDVKQKSWFASMLVRLGRLVGVGILEYAETDGWLKL